tara:strand:+ start:41 stop:193 length:153 start_codon:yes stop_codon:yes gene_type:complete
MVVNFVQQEAVMEDSVKFVKNVIQKEEKLLKRKSPNLKYNNKLGLKIYTL